MRHGWKKESCLGLTLVALVAMAGPRLAQSAPVRSTYASVGADRRAIQALLDTYTRAVSSKDQPLFETILLNKAIPFSDAQSAIRNGARAGGTQNYGEFSKGVFGGPAFRQSFKDITILQSGPLAQVSLVFTNTGASGSSSGWKTLQLLKVDGQWKIASEFYH